MNAEKLNELAADLLNELSAELEALGEVLCSDPAVLTNHAARLQQIDRIAQTQRSLATVIGADYSTHAVGALGLDEIKARLTA